MDQLHLTVISLAAALPAVSVLPVLLHVLQTLNNINRRLRDLENKMSCLRN